MPDTATQDGLAADASGNFEPTEIAPAESPSGGGPPTLGGQSTLTAVIAVQEEQAVRHKAAVTMALLVAILTAIAIEVSDRRAPGYTPTMIGQAATTLTCLALLILQRKQGHIGERQMLVLGFVGLYSILAVTFYTGVFSPAFITAYVGIYYFGLGESTWGAWTLYGIAALGYLGLASLIVFGVVPANASLLPLENPEPKALAAVALALEGILALTFWLARYSRRAMIDAMERLQRAHLRVSQREALLNEARADLDRMFEAGRLGRLTGQTIGPYTVGEVIGRGAMGEVYRATEGESETPLALKVLHSHMTDEMHVERFVREARAASAVKSPHIVRVLGSGRTLEGSHYMAMELLEGRDLGWYLRESRRLGVSQTIDLLTQVADGLEAAQDAGIVHRDLKPQNLFHATDESRKRVWKILDFGVSKIGESGATLTQGGIVGTPSYMSPEQARGEAVDHRTDVFALGVIAYRALTGRPPFTAPDSMSTMYNVGHVQPSRPSDHASLHEDVDRVLALALAKEKGRRFKSATTFAAALRDASRSRLDERFRTDADTLIEDAPWGRDLLQDLAQSKRRR